MGDFYETPALVAKLVVETRPRQIYYSRSLLTLRIRQTELTGATLSSFKAEWVLLLSKHPEVGCEQGVHNTLVTKEIQKDEREVHEVGLGVRGGIAISAPVPLIRQVALLRVHVLLPLLSGSQPMPWRRLYNLAAENGGRRFF